MALAEAARVLWQVIRGAMDAQWLADCNAGIDAHEANAAGAEEPEPVLAPHETARWADLRPEERADAATLGWGSADSWEGAERTAACELGWEELSDGER